MEPAAFYTGKSLDWELIGWEVGRVIADSCIFQLHFFPCQLPVSFNFLWREFNTSLLLPLQAGAISNDLGPSPVSLWITTSSGRSSRQFITVSMYSSKVKMGKGFLS